MRLSFLPRIESEPALGQIERTDCVRRVACLLLPGNRSLKAIKLACANVANDPEDGWHSLGIDTSFDPGKDDIIDRFQPTSRIVVKRFLLPISIESLNQPHEEGDHAIERARLPSYIRRGRQCFSSTGKPCRHNRKPT